MSQPRQSKIRKIFGLRSFLVVNLIILFLVTLSFGREFVRNYEIDQEIGKLEQRALALESQNQDILQLAERLKTDDYLEQEGRLRLGLMKPGENVAVIAEPEEESVQPLASQEPAVALGKEKSNPRLWWEYFFGT
jgi:cell division protein FtsB